jgi:hypothetical protein
MLMQNHVNFKIIQQHEVSAHIFNARSMNYRKPTIIPDASGPRRGDSKSQAEAYPAPLGDNSET